MRVYKTVEYRTEIQNLGNCQLFLIAFIGMLARQSYVHRAWRSTYPNRDAVLLAARRKLDDELGTGLFLGVIERPESADNLDAVFSGDFSLPRRLHCHCDESRQRRRRWRWRLCGARAFPCVNVCLVLNCDIRGILRSVYLLLEYSPMLRLELSSSASWNEA